MTNEATPGTLGSNDGLGLPDKLRSMHRVLSICEPDFPDALLRAADKIELLQDLHSKVYGLACVGEIGVLDPHKTCGGGVYTLWDEIKRAADGVA